MPGYASIISAIGPYIKTAGELAAAAAKARAEGRAATGVANQAQDRTAVDRYQAEQAAKEAKAKLLEEAVKDRADRKLTDAATRAKQVAYGDYLANVQPASIKLPSYIHSMGITGGLNPSALGPMARSAGTNLAQQALLAQMSGSDIPGLPDVSALGSDAPAQTPLPQAGKFDKILDAVGYAGAGIGGIAEAKRQQEKAQAEREAAGRGVGGSNSEIPMSQITTSAATPDSRGVLVGEGRGLNQIEQLLRMKQMQDAANAARANN